MTQTYEGGCHCGRVRFRVTADLDGVTYCNCSVCSKKGFLHLIVPPAQFELVNGKDDLTTYQFNTGTAKHTFCKVCGIHSFYVPRSDPDKIDVNVHCLDGVTICNCSICTKKGIWHLIVPPERFELLQGASDLATYQFNTRVAKHHFCKVCGVHPFYVPRSDPDKIDVNARCLDGFDTLGITPKRFDGRNWEAAMQQDVPWR